jgi:hypothetical protein
MEGRTEGRKVERKEGRRGLTWVSIIL